MSPSSQYWLKAIVWFNLDIFMWNIYLCNLVFQCKLQVSKFIEMLIHLNPLSLFSGSVDGLHRLSTIGNTGSAISVLFPHSAPSWILRKCENLASPSLQDGASMCHYSLTWNHTPTHLQPIFSYQKEGPYKFQNKEYVLYITGGLLEGVLSVSGRYLLDVLGQDRWTQSRRTGYRTTQPVSLGIDYLFLSWGGTHTIRSWK